MYTPTPIWKNFNINDKSGSVSRDSYVNLFDLDNYSHS